MSIPVLRAAALAAALLPAVAQAERLSLARALELAVQQSPAVQSASAGLSSAQEGARAAGQLPDPVLTAAIENLPSDGPNRFSLGRDEQTMKRIGLSQEWVGGDKRAVREALAQAMVHREAGQQQIAVAQTRLQTALAYLDACFAAQAAQLSTVQAMHAHEALEVGKAQLSSGTTTSADVLMLEGDLGEAQDQLSGDQQQLSSTAAALRRWLGIAPSAEDLAAPDSFTLPSESDFVAGHPTVLARQREIDVAAKDAGLAAANRRPNWTWAVSYGQRSGYPDMVSLGVTIPLTVAPAARQDRETAAKQALARQAESELEEARRAALGEYAALSSDVRRLQERIDRYRTAVLAPVQQRSAVMMAAYRSNKATLSMVFEARHAEVESQRKLIALQRELSRAQAQLAFTPVTGGQP
jgi:outer membrane protein, heavy metal efflux system